MFSSFSQLTTFLAFRLETVLVRLEQSLKEQQHEQQQLTIRIQQTDGDIEALEQRLCHLSAEINNSSLSPMPTE